MPKPSYLIISILAICIVSTLAARNSIDRTTVPNFDLRRYLGLWYEIARFDHRFERNLTQVTARYTQMESGYIQVYNRGYNTVKGEWSSAIGKARTTKQSGKLRVSFFLFFYADYNVLAVGDGDGSHLYTWALVGSKSSRYLWILSRTPTLDSATLDRIVATAEARGYDTTSLNYINK